MPLHEGAKAVLMSSVQLSVSERLRAVGEELVRVVETRRETGEKRMALEIFEVLDVRLFVLERLRAVEEFVVDLFDKLLLQIGQCSQVLKLFGLQYPLFS